MAKQYPLFSIDEPILPPHLAGRPRTGRQAEVCEMVDPMKEKLARAHSKLRVFEACGADPSRSERQREQARNLARSARALIKLREDAEAYEQEQRRKLLAGDRSSRCMFLEG